jgi:hypothetical protein
MMGIRSMTSADRKTSKYIIAAGSLSRLWAVFPLAQFASIRRVHAERAFGKMGVPALSAAPPLTSRDAEITSEMTPAQFSPRLCGPARHVRAAT